MREWRYRSTFLDLGTSWRSVATFTLLPIYPQGNRPRYPLNKSLGGHQTGLDAVEKIKQLAPAGDQIRAVQPVALRYIGRAIPTPYIFIHLKQNCLYIYELCPYDIGSVVLIVVV
jgi:hypothetical protein